MKSSPKAYLLLFLAGLLMLSSVMCNFGMKPSQDATATSAPAAEKPATEASSAAATEPPAQAEKPATESAPLPATDPPAATTQDMLLYDDAWQDDGGWDGSWDVTAGYDNADPVHGGSSSIAVTYTAGWSGFFRSRGEATPAAGYTALHFWIHGGSTGGQPINVVVVSQGNQNWENVYEVIPTANTWTEVTVPLSELGSPATIEGFVWMNNSDVAQDVFYLDDISLVGGGAASSGASDSTDSAAQNPTSTTQDLLLYDDAWQDDGGWEGSWDVTASYDNADPVHGGSSSIAITFNAGWSGFFRSRGEALPAAGYTALHFWIHGGATGGQPVNVVVVSQGNQNWENVYEVIPTANTWTEVTVPFSELGSPATIEGVVWMNNSDAAQDVFYLDDISLIGGVAAAPNPVASPQAGSSNPAPTAALASTPSGPAPTVPAGGVAPMQVNPAAVVDGYPSNQFTWYDSQGKPRSAALVKNDQQDPSGNYGGYMRQYTYPLADATTRTVNGSSDEHPGFGYTVNHYAETAGSSRNVAGTYTPVFYGRHHAIHQYNWQLDLGGPVNATVQWFFATGRDYPVYAITFDSSPAGPDVVKADTRSPYGDMQWDGGLNSDVEAVGWGDHYKFISTDSPITLASGWDYSQPNTVPYVVEYASAPDAEMGLVQTQTYLQHDAGGYWFYSAWGTQDADGPMPEDWNWPYQLNQYELPWGSTSKRLAWGSNYGAVGQASYAAFGEGGPTGSLSGYPYQSYSVFVILDRHSINPVAGQVTEIETVQNTTLTASTGTVVTAGPAGLARSDTIPYEPAGYNPIYSTWEVTADASSKAAFTLNVASGALIDPVFVIHNYTAADMPATIKVNGAAQTADIGYFASLDTAGGTLWLTLKGSFSGSTQVEVDGASAAGAANQKPAATPKPGQTTTATTAMPYIGVSLAGADFGESHLPGEFGTDYTYPTTAEVDYFMGKGMTLFRLPFRWERLQQEQFADFDAAELARLDAVVSYATGKGANVLLDPHNYARYYGDIIGESEVPATAFADFWSQLAEHYKDNDRVIFGLMNEPYDMETELWVSDANAAIAAIRAAGAANLILVAGNAWTGAHSWSQNWYGTPNAEAMLEIVDPGDHYAFEVHQYLNSDSSGGENTCVSVTIGSERMAGFTDWLRQHDLRGFLGEFGGGVDATCLAALDDLLTHLDDNSDVYLGWAYWAAGPWWGSDAKGMALEPIGGADRPQMASLMPHLAGR